MIRITDTIGKKMTSKDVFLNFVNVYNKFVNEISTTIDSYGITINQFDVLEVTMNAKGQKLMLSKIGERLRTRKPDITRLVDRLEALNLVTRLRDTKDRRVVFVKLTKKGSRLVDDVNQTLNALHDNQFSCLTKSELTTLNKLLLTMRGPNTLNKVHTANK